MVVVPTVLSQNPHFGTAGAGVNADVGVRPLYELNDRNLNDDRVRVITSDGISPGIRRKRDRMEWIERTQTRQIENRAEIDEEWIIALACKNLDSTR